LVKGEDVLNNWLAEQVKDNDYLVYVRGFQPILKNDVARIKQLLECTQNLVVAIVQVCYPKKTECFEDSFNHPALNPFSYWERCQWINILLSNIDANNTCMVVPFPWYQYELTADELNNFNSRLWIPDRLETFLPEKSLFCTENDDSMLINFLQEEIGPSQVEVFDKYAIESSPHFITVQKMMVEEWHGWQNYVADVAVQTSKTIGVPRLKTLWQKYGELNCTKLYTVSKQQLRKKINMEKSTVIETIDRLNELYRQVAIQPFTEEFYENSKAMQELIVNEVAEFRTILGELERLEEKDVYGKDPSYAQDRYTLNSRLQNLNVRMELEILPRFMKKRLPL